MKKARIVACLLSTASILAGCWESADARFDTGHSDGYAAGYNTTCEIRATMIEGAWDDEDYSRGYSVGYSAGSAACLRDER